MDFTVRLNYQRDINGDGDWEDFKAKLRDFIAYEAPQHYEEGDNWEDRAVLLVRQLGTSLRDLHYVLCVGVRVHFPAEVDQTDYGNASFTFLILDPAWSSVTIPWTEAEALEYLALTDDPHEGGGNNLLDKKYLAMRLGNPNDANVGKNLEADIQGIDWLGRRDYYETLERIKTGKRILPIIEMLLEEE